MLGKRISIEKPHTIFHYYLINRDPWVRLDGYNTKSKSLPEEFEAEGRQAKATAINIAKQNTQAARSLPQQGELISRARP